MKHILALGLLSLAVAQAMTSSLEAGTVRNPAGSYDKTIYLDDKTKTARDFFDQQRRNGS